MVGGSAESLVHCVSVFAGEQFNQWLCNVFTSALHFAGLSVMCCLGDSAEVVMRCVGVSPGNSLASVLSGQRVVVN